MKKFLLMLGFSLSTLQTAFSIEEVKKEEIKKVEHEKHEETVEHAVDEKTIAGWIKRHKKTAAALAAAIVAAGTTGFVYLCPENSTSKYIADKASTARDTIVQLPDQAWGFGKEHYIALPIAMLTGFLVGDVLHGSDSLLFGTQEDEDKIVSKALVETTSKKTFVPSKEDEAMLVYPSKVNSRKKPTVKISSEFDSEFDNEIISQVETSE
jgi:hypothetical protein